MAKVSYSSLKLKTLNETKEIDFNGTKIEVAQYLPIEDKYDLVMITLQNAKETNGLYNPVKINMYFNLYMTYMYANISFTDKQKEDESKLYDVLMSNGLIDAVIEAIPESEYDEIYNYIDSYIADALNYETTTAAIISKIINDLPRQAETMKQIVDEFDPSKYQAVIDFAKAANGGRDI